jgi:ubiquinone/menaquinone biosynthesis C-methylase UbiE
VEKVDYDVRLHAVYAAGRQLLPDARDTWMQAFAHHLPTTRPLAWLDLGAGTGRMAPCLASAFGGPIHGVEPSARMRAQARAHAGHPDVTYSAGSAESIPLPDASCDAALVFFVWHHVVDHQRAAHELHRVVKPGGTLFVQSNFSDAMPDVWWFRVVPAWRAVDAAQFQSEVEVSRDFTSAGWIPVARDHVTWLRSATLTEDLERLTLRAVSLFEHMSEEAIETGFAEIEAALPALGDGPQHETSELLVFRRRA